MSINKAMLAKSFNSMKVRLKRFLLEDLGFTYVFQFHEGPIKTLREFPENRR